jgi:hypothetical protein
MERFLPNQIRLIEKKGGVRIVHKYPAMNLPSEAGVRFLSNLPGYIRLEGNLRKFRNHLEQHKTYLALKSIRRQITRGASIYYS